MLRKKSTRQNIRRGIILMMFILFPLTYNFLSPYIIIHGASRGVVNGSFIMFAGLFVSSLVFGRAWCAWGCPAAGMQEALFLAQNKTVNPRKIDWIKWVIWFVWIGIIVVSVVMAGGYRKLDFFHLLRDDFAANAGAESLIRWLMMYSIVTVTIAVMALTMGKRGFCHTACWMAPFMILGRKLRNRMPWWSLRLRADPSACTDCNSCVRNCPMSLDVNALVHAPSMEHSECILCGNCADSCSKNVIQLEWSAGK